MQKKFHTIASLTRNQVFAASVVISGCLSPVLADAQEVKPGEWNYALNVYLWGASIGGTAFNGQSISVSFSELVDNLDFGLMGSFIARRDKLTLFFDGVYLKVSNGASGALGPIGLVPTSAGVKLKGTVLTGGVGYNYIYNDNTTLTPFGGVRGLWLDATLDLNIGSVRVARNVSPSYVDAIVGVRGRSKIADQWAISYYGDIGTGQSDSTFQALVSVNYLLDGWDLSLGYRYIGWNFGSGEPLQDLSFSGPYIGALYRF